MHAETDSLRDEVVQLRQETQRLQQELDAVKRLLGLSTETAVNQKRLGSLSVEGVFIYPHGGDHPDHADLHLFVTDEGGMIKFRNGPKYPLMTLFCDELGGHVEIYGREGGEMVKLRVKDGSGQVSVFADGHNGVAGLKVQEHGGVVVVQDRSAEVLGLMNCTKVGGEVHAFGKGNKSQVALWHDDFGGVMSVHGKQEEVKAHMRVMLDCGVFAASDAKGKITFLASGGTPMGRIALMNGQEQFPLLIGGDDDGAWLHVAGHDGHGGVRLSLVEGRGRVEVFGQEHVQADLRVDKDGGSLSLNNNDDKCMLFASANPDGGHILCDSNDDMHSCLFGIAASGSVVELRRGNEQSQLHLGTTEHGGMVRVMGNDGMCRAAMDVSDAGGQVTVFNDDRQVQATMHTQPSGGVIAAYGFSGKPRAGISIEDEGGKLQLFDSLGVGRVCLMATKHGSSLALSDGQVLNVALEAGDEFNRILLFATDNEPSVQIIARPDGGLIEVFDTDGGVKASLPM